MRSLHEIELKEIEVILEVYEKNDSELYKTNDQPLSYIYIYIPFWSLHIKLVYVHVTVACPS